MYNNTSHTHLCCLRILNLLRILVMETSGSVIHTVLAALVILISVWIVCAGGLFIADSFF